MISSSEVRQPSAQRERIEHNNQTKHTKTNIQQRYNKIAKSQLTIDQQPKKNTYQVPRKVQPYNEHITHHTLLEKGHNKPCKQHKSVNKDTKKNAPPAYCLSTSFLLTQLLSALMASKALGRATDTAGTPSRILSRRLDRQSHGRAWLMNSAGFGLRMASQSICILAGGGSVRLHPAAAISPDSIT